MRSYILITWREPGLAVPWPSTMPFFSSGLVVEVGWRAAARLKGKTNAKHEDTGGKKRKGTAETEVERKENWDRNRPREVPGTIFEGIFLFFMFPNDLHRFRSSNYWRNLFVYWSQMNFVPFSMTSIGSHCASIGILKEFSKNEIWQLRRLDLMNETWKAMQNRWPIGVPCLYFPRVAAFWRKVVGFSFASNEPGSL